jgi:hypothetical protein
LPPNLLLQATTYCSGRFYFLSRAAVDYLITQKRLLVEKEYFEDYAIGYHLGVPVKEIYPINSNKIFKDF